MHNITLDGATIEQMIAADDNSAFDVTNNASVTLTLKGSNRLRGGYGVNSHSALYIQSGSSVTILGDGSLSAQGGGTQGAGIEVEPGATLTIGKTAGKLGDIVSITAQGGDSGSAFGGAGIGGNDGDDFGTIVINSGEVEAIGGGSAAGIGSGHYSNRGTATGDVIINGGFVVAHGASGWAGAATAAGIGGGENVDYTGAVTVNGGVVYAIGGDSAQASIGGGGSAGHNTEQGTFTTGENGDAVIVAPRGIGDRSRAAEWDCIILDGEANGTGGIEDVSYDVSTGAVTFEGGTPQVYGNPVAKHDISINAPASLHVTTMLNGNAPSTLTMSEGTKLINNNTAADPGSAGIILEPGSALIFEGGTSQCEGEGLMTAQAATGTYPKGVVKLPVSGDMISLNPESYVYSGQECKPAVTVAFNKWNFNQDFKADAEYTVEYTDNVNVGTATATVTAKPGAESNLLESSADKTFQITEATFDDNMPEAWSVRAGDTTFLGKLPEMRFAAGTPEVVKGGTLSWYSDANHEKELAFADIEGLEAGATKDVYWVYTQTRDVTNYPASISGQMTLKIVAYQVPDASIHDENGRVTTKQVTYGDDGFTAYAKLSFDDGTSWADPQSEVTWTSSDENVVKVDQDGAVTYVGSGTATVTANIAEHEVVGNPEESYAAVSNSISIAVAPKSISVDEGTVSIESRPYDGTRAVEVSAQLAQSMIVPGDEDAIGVQATGTLSDPAAGTDKQVSIAYVLTGEKADDYVLNPATGEGTVTISKATPGADTLLPKDGSLEIVNGLEKTYVFNLNNLRPDTKPVGGGASLMPGNITYSVKDVKLSDAAYFSKDDILIDNDSNTMWVKVHAVNATAEDALGSIELTMECGNFTDMTGVITVNRVNESDTPITSYTVTASAGKGGSITPSGAIEVAEGENVSFAVKADNGYMLDALTVDGQAVQVAEDGTYVLENVTADHKVEATFKADGSGNEGDNGGNSGDNGSGNEGGNSGDNGSNTGNNNAGQDGSSTSDNGASDADRLAATGDSSLFAVAGTAVVAVACVAGGVALRKKRL